MTRFIAFLVILSTLSACKDKAQTLAVSDGNITDATYYLIRHADKERGPNAGNDPALTKTGTARAKYWAHILKDVDFDAVYSTNYKRTLKTAMPVAKQNDLPIQDYDATNLFDEKFKQETAGKTVLVVGHSNTTPAFVNAILGEQKFRDIDDSVFGNMYIVRVRNGVAQAELKDFNDWSPN